MSIKGLSNYPRNVQGSNVTLGVDDLYEDGTPKFYRVRNGGSYVRFNAVTSAENYKLDNAIRSPIELWYKSRWNIMGDIPQPRRLAL